ncbi:hypothetical protein THRCLA_09290, partial [Thraustotheca clavata]
LLRVKTQIRRKMGWTRKQAMLEQLSRQCQDHLEHHNTLPVIPVDIKVDSIRRTIRRKLKFYTEWTDFFYTKFFFQSPLTIRLTADLFWSHSIAFFAMGEISDEFTNKLDNHVQNSINVLYGKLLTKIHYVTLPTGAADEFLDYFPYLISRTVYKVAQKAYPEFIFQMRRLTRRLLIEKSCLWTIGMVPKSSCWKQWRLEIKNTKLRHAPKPNLMVRDLSEFDRGLVEELGSDDSNEEDSLSDEDTTTSSVACAEFQTELEPSEAAQGILNELDKLTRAERKYFHGHLEKTTMNFSQPVQTIMEKYQYTGIQGRKLGFSLRMSDKEYQCYNTHQNEHKSWLRHINTALPRMRQTKSLSNLKTETLSEVTNVKSPILTLQQESTLLIGSKHVYIPPCEFELTNPVADARARRLQEAKQKLIEQEQEYVGEIIQYRQSVAMFGQRLDQHLKANPLRRRAMINLTPIKTPSSP